MEHMDLAPLDLNLLVALDALLRHGSVTDAARELGLTQPATSRALQRLRDTLGDPLLVRVGRGVVPTERALALVGPVGEALAAARRVFAPPSAFDPATAGGEVTLGLGDEAQVAFADAIVTALWREAPGIDVRVRALSAASLDEGRRGVMDLAIAPDLAALPTVAGGIDYGDFVAKPLYTRRFVVAARAGRIRGPLDLTVFLAASHAIVSFEGKGRGFVDDLLAQAGHHRRVAASVTSFAAAASLVACTDLLATIPEEVARMARVPLDTFASPVALPDLPMLLLWHPRRTADPRHRFVREVVRRAVSARVAEWAAGE